MKNSNFETLVKPVIVLVVICLITSTMLAVTNNATAPIIAAQEEAAAQEAYQAVLPEADSFTDLTSEVSTENIVAVVKANNGAGYCVKATGKGYGGDVVVMVAFGPDDTIKQIKVTEQAETKGIGSNVVSSEEYWANYAGVSAEKALVLNQDVNAYSGATISSKAVLSAVNSAIDAYNQLP